MYIKVITMYIKNIVAILLIRITKHFEDFYNFASKYTENVKKKIKNK